MLYVLPQAELWFFFLLAALLTLPIPKLQEFKKEKLKIGTLLTILLVVILFFVGMLVSPNAKTSDKADTSKETSVTTTTTTVSTTAPEQTDDSKSSTTAKEQVVTSTEKTTTAMTTTVTVLHLHWDTFRNIDTAVVA